LESYFLELTKINKKPTPNRPIKINGDFDGEFRDTEIIIPRAIKQPPPTKIKSDFQ